MADLPVLASSARPGASASASPAALGAGRLIWVDAARGLCVVAVVMLHFRIFVYGELSPPSNGIAVWTQFTEFFGGFRLPLLFAISGLVVSQRVRNGWSDRRNLARVASTYWIYAVWLCVFGLMSAIVVGHNVPFRVNSWGSFFSQLLVPDTTLWFVFALVLYLVLLTSLRRVHPAIVLGGLALVSIVSGLVPEEDAEALWLHVVYYAVFFAVGVYLRPALEWFATNELWAKSVAALGLFIICEKLWELTSQGDMVESTARLFRDAAAIVLATTVVALASRLPVFARTASAIGRQTLPVFILQLPVIWVLVLLPVVEDSLTIPLVRYTAPILGTIVIVVVSLLVHRFMLRTPLRHLFQLPASWSDRIRHGSRREARAAAAASEQG
ncbi:acyltransferase family protein [Compostimonas suwonensis]|uniref:Acyltransferase-like protein n=1 Tax=Compostimonas suwonensis TaxID=1048394 RepID=A0A2M9BVU6_9MICO|nr:acyltransferase [Compostimonas suwonensis]PJJ62062.1 acyltransferase-like protein [Compostimonas suwonensis]